MNTISVDHLYSIAEPWNVALRCKTDELSSIVLRIAQHSDIRANVRVVRGKKMHSEQSLFDEVSAALQFPYYFGFNWDALDECVADLSWMPADAHILVVQDANEVLIDEPPTSLSIFLRTLRDAGISWHDPIDIGEWWDRPGKPFHTLLHCSPDRFSDFERRLSAIGESVSHLQP